MPIIQKRWTTQPPPGTAIDWSHPLARGLVSALVNGFDAAIGRTSGFSPVGFTQSGVTERGGMPYDESSDVAEVTLVGHHKYTSDNGDYSGHTYGFYTSGGANSDIGIAYGVISVSVADIYGVRRDNANGTTILEADVALPYEAVWACTGTLGAAGSALTYKNGLPFAASIARAGTGTFSKNPLRAHYKGGASSTGKEFAWAYRYARILTPDEIYRISTDPYQIFEPYEEWVPVSAGGGVVISATPGDAVASGPLAQINQARLIAGTPGNAAADGVVAKIDQARRIDATPGNAAADGVTAQINQARLIAAGPGNAVADGVTAQIITTGAVVIDCTPGNAVADGVTAKIDQARLIAATPGNAVAAGVDALISTATDVVINAAPGNAVAAGITAGITANVLILATPGNAVAAGVDASITNGDVAPTAAGWYDDEKPKRKKRFFAEVDGKLLVYGTAKAAANALNRKTDPEEQATSPEAPKPDVEIDLPAVEAFAERTGQTEDYKTALNNKHLEAILKMFSDMEDEDDVEMLLMSL